MVTLCPASKALNTTDADSVTAVTPAVVVIVGTTTRVPVLTKFVTSVLAVVLVKTVVPPERAPVVQLAEVPAVKTPPVEAPVNELFVLTVPNAVPEEILANAAATWAAVAPDVPAVNVSPAIIKVSPADKALNATEADSVMGAAPAVVVIVGGVDGAVLASGVTGLPSKVANTSNLSTLTVYLAFCVVLPATVWVKVRFVPSRSLKL
jgi:hypothetical protein